MTKGKKIKSCLIFTVIAFIASGLWYPILCGAGFTIRIFLITGFVSILTIWGGGAVIYLLLRPEKES